MSKQTRVTCRGTGWPATGRAGPISEWLAQLDVWGRPLASVGEEPGRATAAAADAAEDPFHDDWSGW